MRRQIICGVALSAILLFGAVAGALAQESKASARVLAKGSKSFVLILVRSSSASTESIYEFKVAFTKGKPISSIKRGGWDGERNGNAVTFSTSRNPIKPGSTAIFLLRVSDPAQSAFEWTAGGKDGAELDSGEVAKIRVRETTPRPPVSTITKPEIAVNQARVSQGGQVIVTGKGFSPSNTVQIFLDDQQQLTTSNTNAAGEFSAVVIIPTTAAPQTHTIIARDALGKSSLIAILIEGSPVVTGAACQLQPGQLILTVCTDKKEYNPGDAVKITGTAVLEIPVSLQITDPQGGIICGANPPVNNATMTWQATCFLPINIPGGVYIVQAKQIVHKTATRFTVIASIGGTGGTGGTGTGTGGEDPGPLKLSTDKPSYRSGDHVTIKLDGARAKSIVRITILGPDGPPLESKQVTTDDYGSYLYDFPLVAAKTGHYKVSATQDKYVVRITFEVTT